MSSKPSKPEASEQMKALGEVSVDSLKDYEENFRQFEPEFMRRAAKDRTQAVTDAANVDTQLGLSNALRQGVDASGTNGVPLMMNTQNQIGGALAGANTSAFSTGLGMQNDMRNQGIGLINSGEDVTFQAMRGQAAADAKESLDNYIGGQTRRNQRMETLGQMPAAAMQGFQDVKVLQAANKVAGPGGISMVTRGPPPVRGQAIAGYDYPKYGAGYDYPKYGKR